MPGLSSDPAARVAYDPAMTLPPTHLLYLHGFRSSPQSFKAQRMAHAVAALPASPHWWCPQLPPSPAQAMALIQQGSPLP